MVGNAKFEQNGIVGLKRSVPKNEDVRDKLAMVDSAKLELWDGNAKRSVPKIEDVP